MTTPEGATEEDPARRVPAPRRSTRRGRVLHRRGRRGARGQPVLGPVDQGSAPGRAPPRPQVQGQPPAAVGRPGGRPDPRPGPGGARHHPRRPPPRPRADDLALEPLGRPPGARPVAQKKSARAAEQTRPDVAAARVEWAVAAAGLDTRRRVFLDETFGTTKMTRLYGWGPRSERVVGAVPFGHWKTTTFLAAFRLDGLFAPLVIDGALNGDLFRAYVRQQLAPQLRPGDVVVMDNLATHKVAGVADAVRARDAGLVYLPAYSPDRNPIVQVFSKVKNELRRRELRTVRGVEDAFGESLDWITPSDARNYFAHAGYPPD